MKGRNLLADKDSVESNENRQTKAAVYGRSFDEDVEQNETNTCPECDGRVTTNVHETVCDGCGLVIDEGKVDLGPEWRSFEDDTSNRCRVGAPNTVARHDRGIGTKIGWKRDGNGRALSGAKRAQMARLRRANRRAKVGSKAERNRISGFMEIRRMVSAMGLDEGVCEQACQLFRTAQDRDLLQGRSIEAIATACVYAVCRLNELPRTFEELAPLSKVGIGRIENGYSVLNRELSLPVPPVDPMQYLPRVASAVGIERETERRAREIIKQADPEVLRGVHPGGVAAGALYVAGRQLSGWVTQGELAEAAGVSEATVRARFRELE